jgi:delta 1-pyrroline-5-carboxylate dehydrogenase
MLGRTLAPALAMGNATVMKPAEEACLAPLRIVQLAQEVGFPEGAINVVTGLGEEAGAARSGGLREGGEAGAWRYHRCGTLFRVLRRGRR